LDQFRPRDAGRLPAQTRLRLVIKLPLCNREALTNLLRQFYDSASPQFRHHLTPERFTGQFGPTKADYPGSNTESNRNTDRHR
jgi:subtilase family serine protease